MKLIVRCASVLLLVTIGACSDNAAVDGSTTDSSESPIIGGSAVDITSAPWQVAIFYFGSFNCGGSIIDKNWILTASHCQMQVGDKVSAGRSTWRAAGAGQTTQIAQVVRPDGSLSSPHRADIALLRLTTPLDLSGNKARAIALPSPSDIASLYVPGRAATLTGWGLPFEGGTNSDRPATLMGVTVNLVSDAVARQAYGGAFGSDQVGASAPGKDSCQQDSGGPLVTRSNGKSVLIGVISWGKDCANPKYPGMNTRVGSFLPWIASVVGSSG